MLNINENKLPENYESVVNAALETLNADKIVERIWEHDHTVWRPEPTEITNRLGWLDIAERMQDAVPEMNTLADEVRKAGYSDVLLLGMGGSSLAPEVFSLTFGTAGSYLKLAVLDSTDPGAVLAQAERIDPAKTLFIVATKSGGTVETLSFFKFFYNKTVEVVGQAAAGEHFVAITDAGSKLDTLAQDLSFRKTFRNDPNIGGRYAALSLFGLVPATLIGVDVKKLLDNAVAMMRACSADVSAEDNPGAWLGTVMGELAKAGRDKVTFMLSPGIASLGDWVEQLIAESTGKDGRGILPVAHEAAAKPEQYGDDRLFVSIKLQNEDGQAAAIDALEQAGQPVVRIQLEDIYELGGQFFLWEFATAVASNRIDVQPFNQPDVEAAKILARQVVAEYAEKGDLPAQSPTLVDGQIKVYGEVQGGSAGDALEAFLSQIKAGDYVAIQAYVKPDQATSEALDRFRLAIRDKYKIATTVGYGPRFLHSTGQLHKGDGGNGLFIQFNADMPDDVGIPDEAGAVDSAMSFGVLKTAQMLGDAGALRDNKRRLLRFDLGSDIAASLEKLTAGI